ncbi:uncharacterized protein LOC132734121 [Ruditapes philippinarum]|uniref:uncharacterized protein LOC132734121 n=1 Tax=Ruditapes philippinarum TaxID=129788 RepID=UPI00295A60D0|nr:uncharacterized protein LOC132734121 [Ruditapes philippinarum]
MVVVAEANHRLPDTEDEIARWALDEIGSGYVLINVRRIRQKHVDGTLYNMRLKVREYRPGGRRTKILTCRVKVVVFNNRRTLLSHRCFSSGSGRGPFDSSEGPFDSLGSAGPH